MAIISEAEVTSRYESPMNLFHRLRKSTETKTEIVSIPKPSADQIIPDLDKKLEIAGSKSKALSVMNKVLSRLDNEIEGIRTDRLPGVVAAMSNAIKAMEPEKDGDKSPVQFIIYSPTVMQEKDFGAPIEVTD
jgi:hypothetical protein